MRERLTADSKCPKCNAQWKHWRPVKQGTGCEWCEPRCPHCKDYLKGMPLDHFPYCLELNKRRHRKNDEK